MTMAGCKGCRNDHPYVPYAINDDAGDAETALATDAGEEAGPAAHFEISATQAPPATSRWTTGGLTLAAPAGQVFELAVVRDFDGDGKPDAAALVRRADQETDLGTLLYFHAGDAAPVTVAPSPAFTTNGTCTPKRTMSGIGRHSVWVELGMQCQTPSLREPARQIGIWTLRTMTPRTHLSAQVIDPPGAPKLAFAADGADADNDGLDDVLLKVSVSGGDAPFEPLPRAEASLRWFDRPAGMSRDPDGPDGSLRTFAAGLAARAAKAKEAPNVLAQARAVRVLWSAICGDSRAPRIVKVFGGAPISCGSSRALEEAGLAEARAHAVLGDPLGAITALERAQVAPATKTAPRTKDAENWITQVAPVAQSTGVRMIAAVPQSSRGTAPAWGALAFEPSGKLLVRTAAGVVRVDPQNGDEADAEGIAAWPTNVTSPDASQRFLEAYDACDGVSLHATFMTVDGGDLADVSLPIPPRIGARCSTAKGMPAPVVPLAWGPGGLEALVSGEAVLVVTASKTASVLRAPLGQITPKGSARSPDGKTLAYPSVLGVLVTSAQKSRLVRATDLDGTYAEQRDCTASDDGSRVACVRAGKAWVATF